jgi:hypothetical protein
MAMLMVKRKENMTRVTFSRVESLVSETSPLKKSILHPSDAQPA